MRNIRLIIISGLFFSLIFAKAGADNLLQQSGLINPLRKYIKFKELSPFKFKIEALIKQQKESGAVEEVSVYFRSLADGIWFGIKEKDKFAPASLMKVPLMMAYFKEAQKNPGILKTKIKFQTLSDNSAQYVKPSIILVPGKYYSIDNLIRSMIIESDNNPTYVLLSGIDQDSLKKTYTNLGVDSVFNESGDFLSLKSLVGVIRVLYNASYLNEEMSQRALSYLVDVKFKDGIVSGVPKNITVAHKFGERIKEGTNIRELHDIGIVYYPDNPYLLGIMTRGTDFLTLSKVIQEISELIYQEVDSQCKADQEDQSAIGEDEPG